MAWQLRVWRTGLDSWFYKEGQIKVGAMGSWAEFERMTRKRFQRLNDCWKAAFGALVGRSTLRCNAA